MENEKNVAENSPSSLFLTTTISLLVVLFIIYLFVTIPQRQRNKFKARVDVAQKAEAEKQERIRRYEAERLSKLTTYEIAAEKEIGEKPQQAPWDGSYLVIRQYLREVLKDPGSLRFDGCSEVVITRPGPGDLPAWTIRCRYRAKNSFGTYVLHNQLFHVRHDQVVSARDY